MNQTPAQQQIDDIEARHQAATKGPWRVETHAPTLSRLVCSEDGTLDINFGYVGNRTQADAEFVAHAPEDIAVLLAEVRRLRALVPTPVTMPTEDTPLSDYDFIELVAFASKVESEGFGYAFEEYPPRFEAPEVAPIADDYSLLRRLFDEWQEAVDEFWTRPDAEAAYDAHIDEARRRRREQHAARPVS